MTTSGDIAFNLTANEIILEACELCGIASEGEPVSAYMYETLLRSLNLVMLKLGAEDHLWIRTETTLALVAGQAAYTLSPRPMRVMDVRRKVTASGYETPLLEWARGTYFAQPNKATQSIPTSFYYDPQRDTGVLYLWPTASTATAADMTLTLTVLRKIEDFLTAVDSPDLPSEWLLALSYMVAEQAAIKYVSDPSKRNDIAARAAQYKAELNGWDNEPASLYLQPEMRQ